MNNVNSLSVGQKCENKGDNDVKLWHLRLGHLPFQSLKHVFPNLNVKDVNDHYFCTVCPAARLTRQPFPISNIKTSRPLELIHLDVWGPYRHNTYTGCNGFLTIVDDYTRSTWVYLIKGKIDCPKIIQ